MFSTTVTAGPRPESTRPLDAGTRRHREQAHGGGPEGQQEKRAFQPVIPTG